jgi:hypothetical protein
LAASTSKKVVIHRFQRERLPGFVDPQTWLTPDGIELLSPNGTLSTTPYNEVKLVSFVRDFDGPSPFAERRRFQNRPKIEGLWVRAQFLDNDFQEGILTNDLLQLNPFGFLLVPPDPNSNNQRIFLPSVALKEFHVIGVSGGASKRRKGDREEGQIGLFDQTPSEGEDQT